MGQLGQQFLTKRCARLRDEVVAIGDNYNDLEMLEFAGLPVIMGNASQDLKRQGWAVTLTNDESGVAAAIDQVLGTGVGV